MKKFWLGLVFACAAIPAFAGPLALVYENDAAVMSGKSTLGTAIPDGVIVPTTVAIAGGNGLLVGEVGGTLHRGVLVRLDNDLNLALVRLGEEIASPGLQAAFQARSKAVAGFVPALTSTATTISIPAPTTPIVISTAPYLLKINGTDVDTDQIALPTSLKKAKFNIELVSVSTMPVWFVSVKLHSDPKLAFWKEGRKMGLNDVPMPTFQYDYQAMFKPMKSGDSFKVPVEVFYIEGTDYDWTFDIKTKTQSMQKIIHVKFQSK